MKKILIFVVLIMSPYVQTKIPALDLKGATTAMHEPYEQLSPAYGALYWHSPFIKNIYSYGFDCATKSLTHELFSILIDGITFDCTHAYYKIARYLTPKDLGSLLGILHKTLSLKPEKHLVLKERIAIKAKKTIELERRLKMLTEKTQKLSGEEKGTGKEEKKNIAIRKQIESLKEQLNFIAKQFEGMQLSPAEQAKKAKLQETLQKLEKSLLATSRQEEPSQEKLQTKIADIQKQLAAHRVLSAIQELALDALEQYIQQHINIPLILKTMINGLEQTITRQENDPTASAALAKNKAMLTILSKLENSLDIKELFKILQVRKFTESLVLSQSEEDSTFPQGTVKNILLAFAWKKASTREEFIQFYGGYAEQIGSQQSAIINAESWNGTYTQEDYAMLEKKEKDFSLDDFIFAKIGYDTCISLLPQEVAMIGNAQFQDQIFPDCGETSLRNFFDLLLYTQEKTFDVSILEKLNADQKLIDFYKKYNTCKEIDTIVAHNDWAQVVSARKGIIYNDAKICNISSRQGSTANMLTLISILIPGANTWQNLQTLLKEKCNIEFVFEEQYKPFEGKDALSFEIIKRHEYPVTGTAWDFSHFNLSFPKHSGIYDRYINILQNNPIGRVDAGDTYALLSLYEYSLMQEQFKYIFYNQMTANANKIDILKTLDLNNKIQKPIAKNIFISLSDDRNLIIDALNSLKLSSTDRIYFLFDTLKEATQEKTIQQNFLAILVERILTNNIKELYKSATEKIHDIENKEAISAIVQALIDKQITSQEEKELLKPFYTWAYEKIGTIKNEDKINAIIKALINRQQISSPEERERLKPFYTWAAAKIQAITNDIIIEDLIKTLIKKQVICQEQMELSTELYKRLQVSEFSCMIAPIIQALIGKQTISPEEKDLLKPFYTWAAKNIVAIKGEGEINNIVTFLIKKQITSPEEKECLEPFYTWAAKNIHDIKNKKEISNIAQQLIDKKIENKETASLLEPLYESVIKIEKDDNTRAKLETKLEELKKRL